MNAPMLLPFLSLVCGIFLASKWNGSCIGLFLCIAGSVLYLYLINHKNNPIFLFRFSSLHYIWILLWFLGVGFFLGDITKVSIPSEDEIKESAVAEGEILEIKNTTSGDVAIIMVKSMYNRNGLRKDYNNFTILGRGKALSIKEGDMVIFPTKSFKKITDSPNYFQSGYSKGYNRKGIYYSFNLERVELLRFSSHSFSFTNLSRRIRDKIIIFLEKQPFKKDTRNFIITILAGDKSFLDYETQKVFSAAGVSHILALSGMHVGIIAGIILTILFPLNFLGKYKLRYFLSTLILWGYAFITGMSPSIVRACLMVTAFIIALILERKNTPINSLALAGFVILLFYPRAIYDIGFQLSFLCVGALIVFSDRLNPISQRYHPMLYKFFGIINGSLIATFVSWPLIAYYFHIIPTLFLPANLLVVPLLPFYVVIILFFFIISSCDLKGEFLIQVIDNIYESTVQIIKSIGNDSVIHLNISELTIVLWLTGVVCAGYFIIKKHKCKAIGYSSVFFTFSVISILYLSETPKKGVIICHTYPEVTIKVSNGKDNLNIPIPPNSISFHEISRHRILVVDTPLVPDSLSLQTVPPSHIVITGKYKGNINDLCKAFGNGTIITHSSLRKKREEMLIEEAKRNNVKIYSLRRQNALRLLED